MRQSQQFCAIESLSAGDPLAGTGVHSERNLLISWPRRRWSKSLRIATDMDPALRDEIEAIVGDGRRINLIHRRGWPERLHRLYLFPENLCFDLEREALPGFLAALREGRSLTEWSPERPTSSLMLCCTHGKKDKCCAKFGYASYLALTQEARRQDSRIKIWESSHLGGCRLAASIIVFPALRKYGRVTQEHVEPLLAHEAAGHPYLPCYRGVGTLTPVQQCAEIAARQSLEAQGIVATLRPDAAVEKKDGSNLVTVRWHQTGRTQGTIEIRCEPREVLRVDTCADLEEGPTASQYWTATEIIDR